MQATSRADQRIYNMRIRFEENNSNNEAKLFCKSRSKEKRETK